MSGVIPQIFFAWHSHERKLLANNLISDQEFVIHDNLYIISENSHQSIAEPLWFMVGQLDVTSF